MRVYLGAVAARPRAGFGRVISRGGPNLVLTRVVTAPNQPPRYVIDISVSRNQACSDLTEFGAFG